MTKLNFKSELENGEEPAWLEGALRGCPAVSALRGSSGTTSPSPAVQLVPKCVTGAPTGPCSELGDRSAPQEPPSTRIPDQSGGESCCGWKVGAKGSLSGASTASAQSCTNTTPGTGEPRERSCISHNQFLPQTCPPLLLLPWQSQKNSRSSQAGPRPICSIPSLAGKGLHSKIWI